MFMHAERDIVTANLSVRLSVTLRYRIETNAYVVKLFPPSTKTLVFWALPLLQNSKRNSSAGALYTGDEKKMRFCTEIAVYLGKGTT